MKKNRCNQQAKSKMIFKGLMPSILISVSPQRPLKLRIGFVIKKNSFRCWYKLKIFTWALVGVSVEDDIHQHFYFSSKPCALSLNSHLY